MLCEYGCKQEAKFKLKNGKMCCSKSHNSCPELIKLYTLKKTGKKQEKSKPFDNTDKLLCDYGCGQEAKYKFKSGKICCSTHFKKCEIMSPKGDKSSWWGRKHKQESKNGTKQSKLNFKEIENLDIICEYGCGKKAKYILNDKKYCCSKYYPQCDNMRKINRETSGPKNKDLIKRKKHSELMKIENPMFVEEYREKVVKITTSIEYKIDMSNKLIQKWETDPIFRKNVYDGLVKGGRIISIENLSEWKNYRNKVQRYTRQSLVEYSIIVNPNNYPIGIKDGFYNTDHMYSVVSGFLNNVPPEIIGSYVNLRTIPWKENLRKKGDCSITLEELLLKYENLIKNKEEN